MFGFFRGETVLLRGETVLLNLVGGGETLLLNLVGNVTVLCGKHRGIPVHQITHFGIVVSGPKPNHIPSR